jgi:hypothetical protein
MQKQTKKSPQPNSYTLLKINKVNRDTAIYPPESHPSTHTHMFLSKTKVRAAATSATGPLAHASDWLTCVHPDAASASASTVGHCCSGAPLRATPRTRSQLAGDREKGREEREINTRSNQDDWRTNRVMTRRKHGVIAKHSGATKALQGISAFNKHIPNTALTSTRRAAGAFS